MGISTYSSDRKSQCYEPWARVLSILIQEELQIYERPWISFGRISSLPPFLVVLGRLMGSQFNKPRRTAHDKSAQNPGIWICFVVPTRVDRTLTLIQNKVREYVFTECVRTHISIIGSATAPPSIPEWRSGRSLLILWIMWVWHWRGFQHMLTSTEQWITPRRPYVIQGLSSVIQVELLWHPIIGHSL